MSKKDQTIVSRRRQRSKLKSKKSQNKTSKFITSKLHVGKLHSGQTTSTFFSVLRHVIHLGWVCSHGPKAKARSSTTGSNAFMGLVAVIYLPNSSFFSTYWNEKKKNIVMWSNFTKSTKKLQLSPKSCATVWKLQKFTLTLFWKKFRETDGLAKELLKSWFHGFFSVRVNFKFFHTVSR